MVDICQTHGKKRSEKDKTTVVFWFEGLLEANNSFASGQKNALDSGLTTCHLDALLSLLFILVFLVFSLKLKRSLHWDFSTFLAQCLTSLEHSKQLASVSAVCLRNRCCFCTEVAETDPCTTTGHSARQLSAGTFEPELSEWLTLSNICFPSKHCYLYL